MGLIIKPPSWRSCTNNYATGSSASGIGAVGTQVPAGANNADGSSVSLIAAIAHDVELLAIGIADTGAGTVNSKVLLDILNDPAGGSSWATNPLIPDLLAGFNSVVSGSIPFAQWYFFPIWLPAGSSIGARAQTAHTSIINARVVVHAFGGNANPGSWWCGQSVTAVGIDAANSKGTDHAPGSAGTFSSWANFGSALPAACGALQFAMGGTDSSATTSGYWYEFGVGSQRIGPTMYRMITNAEIGYTLPSGPIFHSLPAGAQLQVRATGGSNETADVAAYAVH